MEWSSSQIIIYGRNNSIKRSSFLFPFNFINVSMRLKDAMDSAVDEYKTVQSELESINTELEDQEKRIDELLAKDKLTYAEKGELEELQKITKELLIQQDIEAKRAERASQEVAQKTVDAYKTQYGKHDVTKDDLQDLYKKYLHQRKWKEKLACLTNTFAGL